MRPTNCTTDSFVNLFDGEGKIILSFDWKSMQDVYRNIGLFGAWRRAEIFRDGNHFETLDRITHWRAI